MGGMHERRKALPVFRPALHILIMGAGHILEPSKLPFLIELLHIKKFSLKDRGFHKHIIFSGLLPGMDHIIQLLDAHSHGNGAAAVLARIQYTDRKRSVGRRRRHQMHRVDLGIVQRLLQIRMAPFLRDAVAFPCDAQQFFILVHQIYLVHIRMFAVNRGKLQTEAQSYQGYIQFFHTLIPPF